MPQTLAHMSQSRSRSESASAASSSTRSKSARGIRSWNSFRRSDHAIARPISVSGCDRQRSIRGSHHAPERPRSCELFRAVTLGAAGHNTGQELSSRWLESDPWPNPREIARASDCDPRVSNPAVTTVGVLLSRRIRSDSRLLPVGKGRAGSILGPPDVAGAVARAPAMGSPQTPDLGVPFAAHSQPDIGSPCQTWQR